ncbi:hypothetical protein PBCV1_a358R [Paramecium bursaria Chlorella virus 1]|uniref:Uncharacterized protein n=1 Tax=Paramecium bursaria Chlorella virus 1 TaxID=10506 RepID=Q84672_PBCV1|nr:hypothetical protein PBCV1_a358R [Paramecium bursaria Chlorella virus 1]AAC96726.2 hypothetical protein [Paramecium bursaria Chlorella virus 1]
MGEMCSVSTVPETIISSLYSSEFSLSGSFSVVPSGEVSPGSCSSLSISKGSSGLTSDSSGFFSYTSSILFSFSSGDSDIIEILSISFSSIIGSSSGLSMFILPK